MNSFEVKRTKLNLYEFNFKNTSYHCQVGNGGIINASKKQEGDGCTPTGIFKLKSIFYRPDKINLLSIIPKSFLKLNRITRNCGWCDDYKSPDYNNHIKIITKGKQYPYSFENLWRADEAYDIFIELDFNVNPTIPKRGSAIFIHCSFKSLKPTSGCIALSKEKLIFIIKSINAVTTINII